eukprot:TRINITY_DN2453_c0_g1_i1.p1 TRINITY_DN2453_c0_g1~~TRINITY_DN2453_c0_g1_i1.p1  ORF type:complete len:137 (-),score=33.69 TRINITY_DN2453_c0_g1_i1:148-558(-)
MGSACSGPSYLKTPAFRGRSQSDGSVMLRRKKNGKPETATGSPAAAVESANGKYATAGRIRSDTKGRMAYTFRYFSSKLPTITVSAALEESSSGEGVKTMDAISPVSRRSEVAKTKDMDDGQLRPSRLLLPTTLRH